MADTLETYRTVTPYLVVADADVELRFLEAAFGATVTLNQKHPDGTTMHAELTIGNSQVMRGRPATSGNHGVLPFTCGSRTATRRTHARWPPAPSQSRRLRTNRTDIAMPA